MLIISSGQVFADKDTGYKAIFADSWPEGSVWGNAAEVFKKVFELESNGRIKVEVSLGGQLGTESEVFNNIQTNTIQIDRFGVFFI